ncbi:U6 snRNA phosphodiesterase [Eurytemora carolleeae]|uniref:U6 snRNA phosphodiesterase n=1 Tax=Eurytemora carolleeae TaxID=1294199 RepID=UPI000C76A1FA|nr:U6 snRNA phosphodiesterase [Eurytemora carolleeae]XP_023345812.1 U6 snRNA phosphodiesterase [Eurytemora carolleeae]|eukprot:XP_023345811.1 U6 snRNA phosphodiesterase-like [Eurytemora affinis]
MALSLLADYSSDGTDSDSDDGISVVINKNPQQKKQHTRTERTRPPPRTKRPAAAQSGKVKTKFSRSESVLDNSHNPEYDEPQESIPLPSTVLTMFDKTEEQEALDSAVFHKGRVRSFPHEKNNWASFIYIDVSDLELDEVRSWLVKELDLEPTEDTHVSLSRTVSLRHHWIDPVIQGISQGFKDVDRFTIKLDKLAVYLNDERTRTFVGLEATGGVPQLSKLSKAVDVVLRDFSLPPFYYPPSFHVSLGWCLGNRLKDIHPQLSSLELKMLDVIEEVDDFGKLFVKAAHCKSGNRFFDFKLK